jgi:triosephosphate isomerase
MKYLIGNLKMNLLSPDDVRQYLTVLGRETTGHIFPGVEYVLCPASIHFGLLQGHMPTNIKLGGQNMFWEKEGSYTGEISPIMLKQYGAEYVILGHSERRLYFGETNEIVRRKIDLALHQMLRPVVCLGETKEERTNGKTGEVIERGIRSIFEGLSRLQAEKIIIAYEPRWAIGADVTPETADIMEVKILIRKVLSQMLDLKTADRVAVLYGGSVKQALLSRVCFDADMDGVLVGRESLFPYEMAKMAEALVAAATESGGEMQGK